MEDGELFLVHNLTSRRIPHHQSLFNTKEENNENLTHLCVIACLFVSPCSKQNLLNKKLNSYRFITSAEVICTQNLKIESTWQELLKIYGLRKENLTKLYFLNKTYPLNP